MGEPSFQDECPERGSPDPAIRELEISGDKMGVAASANSRLE